MVRFVFHCNPPGTGVHILLINYEYPPVGGGAGYASQQWVRHWLGEGHRVTLLTGACGDLPIADEHPSLRVTALAIGRRSPNQANLWNFLRFFLGGAWKIPGILRGGKVDVCVAVFLFPGGPLGLLASLWGKMPFVVGLRGGDVPGLEKGLSGLHALLLPLRLLVVRRARALFANSSGLAEQAGAVLKRAVRVVENGVDAHFFAAVENRPGPPVRILFAGRFQAQKNLLFLLESIGPVLQSRKDLELWLVGSGPQESELRRVSLALDLPRVHFLPWQSPEGLKTCFAACHLLLHLSLYEGMPNAVLQAAACGLPALLSDIPGHACVVRPGETGWLVPLEAQAVRTRLQGLLQEPGQLEQAGRRAAFWVRERFAWSASAQGVLELFKASDREE
jgi:glycosyltransferase involved in cell wall biosynthesis